jgi:hypothetical protein
MAESKDENMSENSDQSSFDKSIAERAAEKRAEVRIANYIERSTLSKKTTFSGLFDWSFSEFITVKVVRLLYVFFVIVSAASSMVMCVNGLLHLKEGGFFLVLLAPFAFILEVLAARITLELLLVIFQIAENTKKLVEQGKKE